MFDASHLAARPANTCPLTPLELLARTVERYPDRPAVAWRDATWSYRAFAGLVARMAEWLDRQGVGPGDVVSLMLGNRPELLAAHFAVPARGAVLNTINTRLEAEDIRYVLEHSGARLLIVDAGTGAGLPEGLPLPVHRLCDGPEDQAGLSFFHGPVPALDLTAQVRDEHQPIALNYTSGTTARPKGVVYTHRGAYLNALGNVLSLGFTRDTRYLWTLPMFHCNGWCHTWAVTAAGGLHVCLDRVDPALILDTIRARGVTHMCCAPVVLYMLLHEAEDPVAGRVLVCTGGAAPTPALLSGLERLGFDLLHLYGLTESYGPATLNDPEPEPDASVEARAEGLARQGLRHMTAGRARVLDEAGQDVPADGRTMGEIVMAGNTLMAGYFRNEEATEAAFRDGLFRTGDMAVMHPDGQIEIRDRAKDVIISGGENISSLEVETALHRHGDVLLAAVVAAPHEKWGEVPWAFVELKPGATADAATLDAFCRQHLAGFKRPKGYVFGPLPKTATGKIQKFRLREIAREGDAA
ncbi:AMP-binding protein [Maritimibacter alkaliphilus]|uniref:AMP-binding protein n=1 Tax=Maritimibacter alkaliphilus TaxID=404236 RepID=UPI001C96ABF5|nr:AMP-binding protein [Maritimibacter alkaliphilus]MBY6092591.1 AMP-binding protein [Maritimibacter alkaliphilus]